MGAGSRRALSSSVGEEGGGDRRFIDRLLHSALIGATLFCAYEVSVSVLDWPAPCEALLNKARAKNEVLVAFGGKVTGSYAWSGRADMEAGRAAVRIPLSGPSGRTGTLHGLAVRSGGAEGAAGAEWALLQCEIAIDPRPPTSAMQGADGVRVDALAKR